MRSRFSLSSRVFALLVLACQFAGGAVVPHPAWSAPAQQSALFGIICHVGTTGHEPAAPLHPAPRGPPAKA